MSYYKGSVLNRDRFRSSILDISWGELSSTSENGVVLTYLFLICFLILICSGVRIEVNNLEVSVAIFLVCLISVS